MLLQNYHGEVEEEIKSVISKIEENNNLYQKKELEKLNEKEVQKEIENLKKSWLEKQEKLSFFTEHDELEKVTECLIMLEENYRNQEYTIALQNSKEFLYWLKHFEEKDKLKLKNVF